MKTGNRKAPRLLKQRGGNKQSRARPRKGLSEEKGGREPEKRRWRRSVSITPGKDIKTFSHYIHNKQNRFLAHIARAPNDDPLRQCTLKDSSLIPIGVENRRVGRPRFHWTWTAYERMAVANTHATKSTFFAQREYFIELMGPRIRNRTIKCD